MDTRTIFPLPLTPFEEYMIKDHHRAYPMVFTIRLVFDGAIDSSRLKRSLQVAIARHPLLSSTICQRARNRHVWQWRPDLRLDLSDGPPVNEATPVGCDRTFPDPDVPSLTESPGLRVRIIRGPALGHETLAVQFHHVCCDGGGALQFIADTLTAYHFDSELTDDHLAPLDPSELVRRNRRRLSWLEILTLLPQQMFGIEGARQFFVRRPRSLVKQTWPALDAAPPDNFSCATMGQLMGKELSGLMAAARAKGATTHELMTRELFLAVRDFQAARGQLSNRGWLRLNIPINLRRSEHERTSAANIVSMVFLDRKPTHMRDLDRLLSSLHGEMSRIKKFDVKYTYLYFAQLLHWLPGGFDLVSRSRKCHATMVLTNLGKVLTDLPIPYVDGNLAPHRLLLREIDLTPPYRPLCNAAMALVNYNQRISINLHFDPRAMSASDSQSLLELYLNRLHGLSQSRRQPAPGPQV